MYQTFDDSSEVSATSARIAGVRAAMAKQRVEAVLVPRADEYKGEYVPPSAERLAWLTGFTGSAGLAILGRDAAALFVDGRYTAQAPTQVDTTLLTVIQSPPGKPSDWLTAELKSGETVGFDPKLHSIDEIERLRETLAKHGIKLRPLARNLVDIAWGAARPAPPRAKLLIQPDDLAGQASIDKLKAVQARLGADKQHACILTSPDSIAWLFNIRGQDVAHNPVPLAFAIVPATGKAQLFVDPAKLTPDVRAHLKSVASVHAPEKLGEQLAALKASGKLVQLDPATASFWFWRQLGGNKKTIARASDPTVLPKARKNAAEIAGARAAQRRDGAAMAHFLAWLDATAASGTLDEITVVEKLEAFRRDTGELREISFDTISGAGPNGAIVHYRVTRKTNRKLHDGDLLLVDSGAQYRDGTTDVTRTIAIGTPSAEMRQRFTLVLKGHIAIATARFPKGTRGVDLDPFARNALWRHGLDFDHGTGHGVGSYLSVHEGPQSISKRGMIELEPGMIVSNEPGYYKNGAYGIRIENLVLVEPTAVPPGGDRAMMSFETLTLVPIDRRVIDPSLLDQAEVDWLDAYHARVAREIGPLVDGPTGRWLKAATKPLA